MLNETALCSVVGSLIFFSLFVIILIIYVRQKSRRTSIWEIPTNAQPITNSAPTSRRTSTSCLINLEKTSPPLRARSASFSEDLTARLQILAADSCYRSYSPAIITTSPRPSRSSLGANIRFPVVANIPTKLSIPSLTFQLRYESTIETVFITIFQLENYSPTKHLQSTFLILYLLPNDDEQRQTQSSTTGVFNEHFHFPLKADELSTRTLRLTAYTVDSTTRVRHILGHVFLKFDQFLDETKAEKTFSTHTLSECLMPDLHIRSDYLGEMIMTNTYFKEQNLIHIRIQQINHFHIDSSKIKPSLKAHFSGQTSNTSSKHQWINTSTFLIPSSPSFRVDQELNLTARSLILSTNEDHVECHLRLHLHGSNEIHSHARWQRSLRSNLFETINVPLLAL